MNIKRATNSQLSTTEPKKKNFNKQSEWEQKHRYRDHLEGYQVGGGGGIMEEKVQGLKSIIGRYKIDRRMSRIV